MLNLWVKSAASSYTNPASSTADILFKEIDTTFDTGAITTTYP